VSYKAILPGLVIFSPLERKRCAVWSRRC